MRIGHGYDVHKLVVDRKLILCGVEIPFEKGLLGHSDADVAIHSLIDSLLGACALGDIGRLFPDTDPQYKEADSRRLLRIVVDILHKAGYFVGNIDCTILAQQPKLLSYIEMMRKNIAQDLCVEIGCINIKATTEEGLGFTGNGEGIAAHTVCLIKERK